ncbi:MAG: cysteine desulfurase [Akkermansiaceae bacterium]|nr:cysteine desulfurase [Akkermansiaceae bacterium]
MIYWDNNATTPLVPEVLEAMRPFLTESFFNPSASYRPAKRVRQALEEAREKVAALLGAAPGEIIFTSGGTESSNTALSSFERVLTLPTEHPATLRSLKGRELLCPVLPSGVADAEEWRRLLPGCDGASFAWANHETGVVQPVELLCRAAQEAGARVHLDVVQAAGKLPMALHELPAVDYASVSAHKLHGPKGVGALYVRAGAPLHVLLQGGGQESARRSGTENVAGIVGFGKAAELAMEAAETYAQLGRMRDLFLAVLAEAGIHAVQNGAGAPRLPHVLNFRIPGCTAESLSLLLEPLGLLCSAGSACTSAEPEPSHVLLAMGLAPAEARECLRLSWSRFTSEHVAKEAAGLVVLAVNKLRAVQSASTGPVMVYKP